MPDVTVVFTDYTDSLIQKLTAVNGTSSLFQAVGQLVSEGLVSVPAPCSQATDWPVDGPRHLHLLGHLSETHHQLPHTHISAPLHFLQAHRRKTQRQTGTSRPHHSFLVVIGLWVHTHYHPHFPFPIKVVFKQMCKFGVSVWHHLEDKKRKDEKRSGAILQQARRYQP